MIVVATAVAFVAWFGGLRRLSAATVGLIGMLNPVTGVVLGAVVAGEALAGVQLAGVALVFCGIVVGQRARSVHPAAPPRPRTILATSAIVAAPRLHGASDSSRGGAP